MPEQDAAAVVLRSAVNDGGREALSQPQLIANLCADLLAESPRYASALVAAATANIARVLQDAAARGLERDAAVHLAVTELSARHFLPVDVCVWVSGLYADALMMFPSPVGGAVLAGEPNPFDSSLKPGPLPDQPAPVPPTLAVDGGRTRSPAPLRTDLMSVAPTVGYQRPGDPNTDPLVRSEQPSTISSVLPGGVRRRWPRVVGLSALGAILIATAVIVAMSRPSQKVATRSSSVPVAVTATIQPTTTRVALTTTSVVATTSTVPSTPTSATSIETASPTTAPAVTVTVPVTASTLSSSGSPVGPSGRLYPVTQNAVLRDGPTTTADELGVIPSGTLVGVQCKQKGEIISATWGPDPYWDQVVFNGVQGFVTDEWVDTQGDEANDTLIPPC